MKKVLFSMMVALTSVSSFAGTIVGSAHDFQAQGWANGQICVPCHTPHNANLAVADAPLWNHALSTATYTLYSSATLNSTIASPSGVSKLCLSCHDGTVAVNSFGNVTGTTIAGSLVGTNLKSSHPIGFTYDAALVTLDPSLKATTTSVTIGGAGSQKVGTIASNMLFGGKMECSSCHDVHNTFTAAGGALLKVASTGSALCITCHAK